jgi:heptosyltransferase-2
MVMPDTLIIRTSVSRLQDGSFKSNLGDLLRSTLVTRLFDDWQFATDQNGYQLLDGFIEKDKIFLINEIDEEQIPHGIQRIINLDNHLHANPVSVFQNTHVMGFVCEGGTVRGANQFMDLLLPYSKSRLACSWQEALVRGLGFSWMEQDYPDIDAGRLRYDVGLNHLVHQDWPSKSWPREHWIQLANLLQGSCSVSWQQGKDNLFEYKNWIRACRVVVTCDSLGLHLASAYGRKVVCLAGPTQSNEYSYGRVLFLKPTSRACMPCRQPVCDQKEKCLKELQPQVVAAACLNVLNELQIQ